MKLQIGENFTLAENRTDDVIAILGRRGKGKTTTAVVIVEELHAAGARFCVADPTGVWWGLKSSRDGKRPGIPCVVMGGEHADVPLASESGEVIADFVADPASPSCVLDLKPFTQGEIVRFMGAFLQRLYHKNAHPLHLVLDEADQFAPQRPLPGEQAMLGAAQRVTKMGRSRGLHPLFITQRPATLAKNVLTQAGMLISHAITGPQDRNAVDDWIKANANEDERAVFLSTLAEMPRGTAWFWNPDMKLFLRVAVRDRHTFDSSAAPDRGTGRVQPKALAEVDLEALKVRIAGTIERAKADDPRELRKKIAELQAELRKAASQKPTTLAAAKREVPTLKDAQIKRLEAVVERMRDSAAVLLKRHGNQVDQLSQRMHVVVSEAGMLRDQLRSSTIPMTTINVPPPSRTERIRMAYMPPQTLQAKAKVSRELLEQMPGVEQKILDELADLAALGIQQPERAQLGLMAGYTNPRSGGFSEPLGRLIAAGFIGVPRPGLVSITAAGLEHANPSEVPPTTEHLQERILKKLGGVRANILQAVIAAYPQPVGKDALGRALGYTNPRSGGFSEPVGSLRTLGLIDYPAPGQIIAAEVLFLGRA